MRFFLASLALALAVLVSPIVAAPQSAQDFNGRVFDATSKRGIENLEVKLTPPRESKLPVRLATTDPNGAFVFRKLVRGRYLLEISQGLFLLYRGEIDTARQPRVDIPLKPKR
jgi:Carboxypeptidase regulatory-like domain